MPKGKVRLSEERMLNDMFVLLEYSDNFKEFVEGMAEETFERLRLAMMERLEKYYKDK